MAAEIDPPRRQRRRFARRDCQHPIVIVYDDNGHEVYIDGECRSLSPGGFGAILERELPTDRIVAIHFQAPRVKQPLSLQAKVVYEADGIHGFEFVAPDDRQRGMIATLFREAIEPNEGAV